MRALLDSGEGTLFRFAIVLLILGLGRHVVLSVTGILRARRQAGKKEIRIGEIAARTIRHTNPLRYVFRTRGWYTLFTLLMHAGILVVPLFLAGHIVLWRRGLGLAWPHLPMPVADALTLATIGALVAVIVGRLVHSGSRPISRPQDWLLPPLILVVFVSGYLSAHPHLDVLPYPGMRLLHVLSGDLVLLLVPFTKIAHMVLLPFSQLAGEMAWRFVPGAGTAVRKTLGKEGQKI